MSLDEKLSQAVNKTFGKFCDMLAKIDPATALIVTAGVTGTALGGTIGMEMLHQREVFLNGGLEALNAYMSQAQVGGFNFIALSMANALPSETMNHVGQALAAAAVLPITAFVSTMTAGVVKGLKDEIATLEQGGRQVERRQTRTPDHPVRDTCATKLSTSEMFGRSLEAFSRSIETIQQEEDKQGIHQTGPRP